GRDGGIDGRGGAGSRGSRHCPGARRTGTASARAWHNRSSAGHGSAGPRRSGSYAGRGPPVAGCCAARHHGRPPGRAPGPAGGAGCGLAAAAGSGWARVILARATETAGGFPFLVLAAPVIAIVGRGYWPLLIVLAILASAPFALAVFDATWGGRGRMPVFQALYAVPAALPVVGAFIVADLVVTEACLSFLGAGAPAVAPSWGNMLADARKNVTTGPWILYAPAAALVLTVLSANWFGEGLGQLWRVKAR